MARRSSKTRTSNLGIGLKVKGGKSTKSTRRSVGGSFGTRKQTIAKQKAEFRQIRKSDALISSLTRAKTTAARQRILLKNETAIVNRILKKNPGLSRELTSSFARARAGVITTNPSFPGPRFSGRLDARRGFVRSILTSVSLRRFLGQRIRL